MLGVKKMFLDDAFFRSVIPGVQFPYASIPADVTFWVDSRTIKPGQIFVALKGARVDGHTFIAQALRGGASGVLCAVEYKRQLDLLPASLLKDKTIILVPDPLEALIRVAHAWRMRFNYHVVAITGSVGKTSTKELLSSVLSMHNGPYLKSEGNQNSLIGIALNMLKMRAEHKGAIFEVGIDSTGQMKKLSALIKPTIALITNVGHSHMQGIGAIADVAAQKRDLFSSLREDNVGIINGDISLLADVGYPHPVIKFGTKTINQIQARKILVTENQTSFVLKMYREKYPITIGTNHPSGVMNALAVAAVAHVLGVPVATIIKGIERPIKVAGRYEKLLLKDGRGTLINDCYNANPESVKAALIALQATRTKGKKIAILGDMLELGNESAFWHRQIGRFLRKVPSLDYLILVGKHVQWIKHTAPITLSISLVPTWQEAIEKVNQLVGDDTLILVKGSRGMHLEHIVNCVARVPQVNQVTG